MTRFFMDGGSGINIVYTATLKYMGIPTNKLAMSENTYHRIVPGKAIRPLGTIALGIYFGTKSHFRKERLDFEVVDWPSQYLLLRMPGPKGVITVYENYKKSHNCDIDFNKISQSFGTQQELAEISATTDHSVPLMSQKTAPGWSLT